MQIKKKIILFADSVAGYEITKFIFNNYPDDIFYIVVTSESNEIYTFAKSNHLSVVVFQSEEYEKLIFKAEFDTGFLLWWPTIIKQEVIVKAEEGFINTHPSYMPNARGKNYNFWTLIEECPYGVSIHYVNKDIDAGDILLQKKIEYDWTDNGETMFYKARHEMINLFKEFYIQYKNNKLNSIPQNLNLGSFHYEYEMEKKSLLKLSEDYNLRNLLNILRARTFNGNPSCYFQDEDTKKTYEIRIEITEKFNKN